MTIFLAILGLGVLIFVHELGHFVVSLALGMRPRRFYIGFPPAIWKTTRNGIEYGIGAIPLGGFVKIPGMHRPAPVDVDIGVRAGARGGAGARRRRRPAAGGARGGRPRRRPRRAARASRARRRAGALEPRAARPSRKGLDDIDDALGPDAYWRAATWKRVAAIAAGPAANIVLALVLFTVLFMTSAGKATTTVERVSGGSPAARGGPPGGRPDRVDRRDSVVGADEISRVDLRLGGQAARPSSSRATASA